MKKIITLMLITLISISSSITSVSASTEVKTEEELLKQEILKLEIEKMQLVYNNHYLIDCDSKESKKSFKDEKDLKELYKETCKSFEKNKDNEAENITYMNSSLNLVTNFVEYDLENDLFYIDLDEKMSSGLLADSDLEILRLTKFYFENDFSVNGLVIDKAINIVYSNDKIVMMRTISYSDWTEYSRSVNYAKQWVSDKLRNVDKVYEKRTMTDFTDWVYTGYTSCKTFKPSDTDYKKYEKKENCGLFGIGNVYNIYERSSSTSTEYRTSYELKSGLFDETVDKMPTIEVYGNEKFYIGKTLFKDYVLVPYHGDHKYFEVDLYFNNYFYNTNEDNFITSKSVGAKSGELEQTLKYRGKIIGNYRGSRYAYTYQDFEFRDGRVDDCSFSSCFTTSYYDNLDDEYNNILNGVSSVDVLHTLITNFLFYKDSLGDLYIPTNDYPYVYYGNYVEYNSNWIQYTEKLNEYARKVFYLTEGDIVRGMTKNEHYFRNIIQEDLFPDNLDDFVSLNSSIIPSQRWYVYDVEKAIFHMNDFDRSQGGAISESEKGEYNIKVGSYNGCFELVYSTYNGIGLTDDTDWVNMGTYNYDGFNTAWHTSTDVIPYKQFGNNGKDYAFDLFGTIAETALQLSGNIHLHENYIAWEDNQTAVDNYNYYKDLIE